MFNLSANQLPSATPFGLPNGAAHFPLQQQIQQVQQQLQQLQQLQHLLQQQQQQFAPQFQQPFGQSFGQPFAQPFGGQQQFQPQGFFGDLLKQYGGAAGGAIGGLFGQPGLGQTIGNVAGQIGGFLPFQMQPGQQSMSQFPMSQFGGMSPANLPIQFSQQPGLC